MARMWLANPWDGHGAPRGWHPQPHPGSPRQHWGARAGWYSGMDLSVAAWVLLEHPKPHTQLENACRQDCALTPQQWALAARGLLGAASSGSPLCPSEPPGGDVGCVLSPMGHRPRGRGSRTGRLRLPLRADRLFYIKAGGGICCSRWYFNGQPGSWSLGEACFTLFGVVTNKFN